MALGEGSAHWGKVRDDQPYAERNVESSIFQIRDWHEGSVHASTNSGWGPLLAFAVVMAVPFGLVAWLMS